MNTTLLLLQLTFASPGSLPPPQAPPVQAPPVIREKPAPGGPAGPSGVLPDSTPPAPAYDPYRLDSYAALREHVARGFRATLFVGVPDTTIGTYVSHLWVPSGFKGLADGVYDCHRDPDTGLPVMTLRRPSPALEVRQPASFRGASSAAGLQRHSGHDCPARIWNGYRFVDCPGSQFEVAGDGPTPRTHTHRCSRCGTTWFH